MYLNKLVNYFVEWLFKAFHFKKYAMIVKKGHHFHHWEFYASGKNVDFMKRLKCDDHIVESMIIDEKDSFDKLEKRLETLKRKNKETRIKSCHK